MTSNPAQVRQPKSSIQPKRMNKMAPNQATNLNHLLNFTLPPRQTRPLSSIPRRSRKTGNVHGVWNKERFVNAQYRFVMNPSGDYTVHFADPDIYFQWQDILQIIVPRPSQLAPAAENGTLSEAEGVTTCPICLSPPTAPRMTKCGHVFCFPCILHYLSTSETKWARCPICFDSVNERQLKCVKWYEGPSSSQNMQASSQGLSSMFEVGTILEPTPSPGSSLRMRLIQRPSITTLALPRSQTWPSDLLPPHQAPFHFLPDVYSFAKFMLATPSYLIADLTSELDQLAEERRVMKDDMSVYFFTGAEEKVREQIDMAAALETPSLNDKIDKALRDQKEIQDKAEMHAQRTRVVQSQPQDLSDDVPAEFLASRPSSIAGAPGGPSANTDRAASQIRGNGVRQRRNINPPPPSTSTYYYYQAASGLPIYLHPLDIKILLSHFNSYSSFPDEITVRVEASSEGSVNDDLRKRCKYLAHLPESADVIFVETDLEGVVGPGGLKNFEGHLRTRSAKRTEKARKDDKAKAKAEEREREKEREVLSRFMHHVPSAAAPIVRSDGFGLSPGHDGLEPPEPQSTPAPSGAWGSRSFASALHSSDGRSSAPARRRELTEEEWDAEEMWHDLEQRTINASGGGKKKKGARMVVLGGSGARRR